MQNPRDQRSSPDPSENKMLRRMIFIFLIVFVFIAIAFGIYQGINILRTPEAGSTESPTGEGLSPNLQATATAGCENFMQQFPGTPCPEQEP